MAGQHDAEERYGKAPSSRTVEELLDTGIIVIDKPSGPTSHQVSAWVSKMLGGRKVGHGGTLDPAVTGVLPVGIGLSVRALDALHFLPKEYVGVMRFHADVGKNEVSALFSEFTGRIYQFPPVRSAVRRERRIRQIHSLELLEMSGRMVLFRVECEAGTYIRTLCRDIGEASGAGGQMIELRRTRSGPYKESMAVTLQGLEDAVHYMSEGQPAELLSIVRPFETLLQSFPMIILKDSAVDSICHGANLTVKGVASVPSGIKRGSVVSLMSSKGEGIALANALMSSEMIDNTASGIACDTLRVFMKPGTYPRFVKQK